MTRPKAKPLIAKPDFAAAVSSLDRVADRSQGSISSGEETAKRLSVTLLLKRDVIARLEHEASRKEKSVAQVVEKLVAKHLDKP
jgi:hypothetical protein